MNSNARADITSDVANNAAVEHAKLVHKWAATHPEWKRQHIPDRPKIKNRCGECAAFRTSFCTWNTFDGPGVKMDDDACGAFCPPYRMRKRETTTIFVGKGEKREVIEELNKHGVR